VRKAVDASKLKKLITAMAKDAEALGPIADGEHGAVLGPLSDTTALMLDYGNFKLPPKRRLFPQCEVISTYADGCVSETKQRSVKTVLFGIRPCDAQAIAHLDKVFLGDDAIDPYYKSRRDATLVISLACRRPASTECFCSSTGAGPASKAGADAMAWNLGTSLLFESITVKGEAFLKKHAALLREATPEELQASKKQESATLKELPTKSLADVPKLLKNQNDPAIWEEVSSTCLSCGACTYLCPTCHCFDFYDEKQGDGARKLRLHDACMFESFALEASGHNPRARASQRMRQRVMHKFSYAPENYNELFCVGCGRCIIHCPSSIDIRETVSKVIL
jgi:ferredoxin